MLAVFLSISAPVESSRGRTAARAHALPSRLLLLLVYRCKTSPRCPSMRFGGPFPTSTKRSDSFLRPGCPSVCHSILNLSPSGAYTSEPSTFYRRLPPSLSATRRLNLSVQTLGQNRQRRVTRRQVAIEGVSTRREEDRVAEVGARHRGLGYNRLTCTIV